MRVHLYMHGEKVILPSEYLETFAKVRYPNVWLPGISFCIPAVVLLPFKYQWYAVSANVLSEKQVNVTFLKLCIVTSTPFSEDAFAANVKIYCIKL